jgi:Flp pilus assembly protein TadD
MNFSAPKAGSAPGRNEACPCGSGRKYKHCCAIKAAAATTFESDFAVNELRRGLGLEQNGRIGEALVAYEVAAADLPEARSRLARTLETLGRIDEAIGHFRAAAGVAPTTTDRRMDLVMALVLEERMADAEAKLRELVAADPGASEAHALLGRILAESGQFDTAADCFRIALAQQPQKAGVYYHLARARKLTEADRPLIRKMIAAAPAVTLADHTIKLNLAIAKAFDDLGEYEQAIRHIGRANVVRKTLSTFDRGALAGFVDALIGLYTPQFLARREPRGDPSEQPVLIVGMPRSGTTLTEQILSSHPAVAGAGELSFWPGRDPLLGGGLDDARLGATQSAVARDCLALLKRLAPGAVRVIDKNPYNFFCLGLFHIVFPRGRIVHCRRHPIDTCLSIVSTHLNPRGDVPFDFDDLAFYYRQYQRLMDHWRVTLQADRFFEVDYEAVVADPETQSRALVASLGLDWDPACLRPEDNRRVVRTSSAWQVRQPIYRASLERWRRYEPWLGALSELLPGA